uniref:Uncharacterized protein n=1 Tax=Anopheles quadriannulatus TaxID=34691 RepID=A0A182XTA9_ANOQN
MASVSLTAGAVGAVVAAAKATTVWARTAAVDLWNLPLAAAVAAAEP